MTPKVHRMILEAIDGKYLTGDSFRLRHAEVIDGKICTPKSKDPAMTVTRITNGYMYHCHRCHTSGIIYDESLNPSQTAKRVKALQELAKNSVTRKVALPVDFALMDNSDTDRAPVKAYNWLMDNGIFGEDLIKFNIGWSHNFNRVIIPLYEYAQVGEEKARKLVGWVGREVDCKTKEERKKKKISKYMTYALKGKRRYFIAPGDEEKVVLVEDVLSAIRINIATEWTAIALLTTSVGPDTIQMLRGKEVYLWLDGDMKKHSIKTVMRMTTLGLKAKHIYTAKDPKKYALMAIREVLRDGKEPEE